MRTDRWERVRLWREGIPDVCQRVEDCNNNGLSDVCDPDRDGDGNIDDCDNCPDTPNGVSLGTCIAGKADRLGTECTVATECDTSKGELDGVCDKSQVDTDGDGVGDVCDNCVTFCNPPICHRGTLDGELCSESLEFVVCPEGACRQVTSGFQRVHPIFGNARDIGEACVLHIGGEIIFPPTYTTAEGCDPSAPIPCECVDYTMGGSGGVHYPGTGERITQELCVGDPQGGVCFTNADCPSSTCGDPLEPVDSSVIPAHLAFVYDNVYAGSGRLFVAEKAPTSDLVPVEVTWRDSGGIDLALPAVQYFLTDRLPAEVDRLAKGAPLPYSVDNVNIFRNITISDGAELYRLIIESSKTPTVKWNSVIRECPGSGVVDLKLGQAIGPGLWLGELSSDVVQDGYVVILWAAVFLGSLDGLEVVHIAHVPPLEILNGIVGQQFEIPAGADCSAVFKDNQEFDMTPAAFQRIEKPLEIWPIRPEPERLKLEIVWNETSTLGHCWPISHRRYASDWPGDPQTFVIDTAGQPNPPLVDLPISDDIADYCVAELMFQERDLVLAEVTAENEFVMKNPGRAVLRFDRRVDESGVVCSLLASTPSFRESVTFEVIRAFNRDDEAVFIDATCVGGGNQGNPCTQPWDCPDGECAQDWRMGKMLEDPSHELATRNWPYGYLHAGQPFAPCIYDETLGICIIGTQTGQIFPVNSGDFHGTLEAVVVPGRPQRDRHLLANQGRSL